tara:strand:- start:979 stop:1113 length:135 start_codon:yes stop_codon:yes gene_type:complete
MSPSSKATVCPRQHGDVGVGEAPTHRGGGASETRKRSEENSEIN